MTDQLPQIPLSPVPTQLTVTGAEASDGTTFVVLQVQTPQGTQTFFMDRDCALTVASNLRKQANGGPQLVKPDMGTVLELAKR